MTNKNTKIREVMVPIIAVICGLFAGALIMLIFGFNPVAGYSSLIQGAFGTTRAFGEVLRQASPLIFTAIGFAVASAAGFFNIGLSGQALAGWVASVWFALAFPDLPRAVLLPACVLIGALAGALTAAVPGVLRAYFGTSEVIVTIMMNYIILYSSTYILQNIWPETYRNSVDSSIMVSESASLRVLGLSRFFGGSRVNLGLFLALIALVVIWIILKKTSLGFEIRSVGMNPFASEYAGMSSKQTIIISMVLSGVFAGLAGVVEGLGTYQNFFVQSANLAIGFDGMAVSLLGAGTPLGILLAAILFSALQIGGLNMQTGAGIPFEIVSIITALIIFFVAIRYVIEKLLAKGQGKKAQAKVESEANANTSDEGGSY
ncbi:ABC transporter permease [Aerococcus kribbianus]|uniref:ABC transporter permease n=1 Tax=Aerococcus kribbianus TaxID=2999064 RepID=A0A9X3FM37_9LACT|nr:MULTISPECIES: ABC transporter permease [unclassified Aerococcus]MCZ0717000.1 ABC transporter permease [Aerococcus sp. YH-aer221]MCZ0725288.1 ABC transporter permease [Aerococcus sp. YH-aer222]